jgi:hypothetical protein
LGAAIGISVDRDGKSIWVYERCGGDTCEGSNLDPIFKLDPAGKVLANFGGGKVNWPHGFTVDSDDNVWVSDGRGGNGKGHDVIKFSPDGKVLAPAPSGKPLVHIDTDFPAKSPFYPSPDPKVREDLFSLRASLSLRARSGPAAEASRLRSALRV